jgi:hypothetical protein
MAQNELVQIETASMAGNEGLEYQYQVVINQQETPAISLDGLRELRRLCDCFIRFGEDYEKSNH